MNPPVLIEVEKVREVLRPLIEAMARAHCTRLETLVVHRQCPGGELRRLAEIKADAIISLLTVGRE